MFFFIKRLVQKTLVVAAALHMHAKQALGTSLKAVGYVFDTTTINLYLWL
ncbi:hypothetical protein HC248_03281 [Polaromonas vacuolata]|uniref:Uncharacterized protein n=1 Tax=Polaromonas vacuolata TaxID=37448 RepID=A0A6H2HDI1_9BURK|nr:hypothetical protein HC248_03281 [Polaromonas vacuolata]